jgi:hypothetical protein
MNPYLPFPTGSEAFPGRSGWKNSGVASLAGELMERLIEGD